MAPLRVILHPLLLTLILSTPILALRSPATPWTAGDLAKSPNCHLPQFTCAQYGMCNVQSECKCPAGWGGVDCLIPQCDSLADGPNRQLRENGTSCECKDGWGGINCNVCKTDAACAGFRIPLPGDEKVHPDPEGMTCYKGGDAVFSTHQICNVTNRLILQEAEGQPVQATFSCDARSETCAFQLWIAEVESFYCALEECVAKTASTSEGFVKSTTYACEQMKCSCVPGRIICGKEGSVDITEFLHEEIKGPASFTCSRSSSDLNSAAKCTFVEPAADELMRDLFGDAHITMGCEAGECIKYSQIPGYKQQQRASEDYNKQKALAPAWRI
ncbi:hypothetical protein DFH08DRAFT_168098 [Mycena albidolilacea]|uniref:EGF-like domain-containing protein n=1 Tax=Mycena albidolilacea TaxID=1033008 RepID=A0AAD7ARF1_9AGAR|nr:hypothetical protein DFH08DRAFT_168098 [Mycena albidolilacea]